MQEPRSSFCFLDPTQASLESVINLWLCGVSLLLGWKSLKSVQVSLQCRTTDITQFLGISPFAETGLLGSPLLAAVNTQAVERPWPQFSPYTPLQECRALMKPRDRCPFEAQMCLWSHSLFSQKADFKNLTKTHGYLTRDGLHIRNKGEKAVSENPMLNIPLSLEFVFTVRLLKVTTKHRGPPYPTWDKSSDGKSPRLQLCPKHSLIPAQIHVCIHTHAHTENPCCSTLPSPTPRSLPWFLKSLALGKNFAYSFLLHHVGEPVCLWTCDCWDSWRTAFRRRAAMRISKAWAATKGLARCGDPWGNDETLE